MNNIFLIITILAAGLIAGLFYAWSISVTPGLAKVGDENFLQAFQAMNRAIINPIFLICFIGLTILLPILSYLSFKSLVPINFWYTLSATILYLLGVMAVTFLGNIPLNDSLEVLNIETMSSEQMASFRLGFENKWNKLNVIRTIASFISFAFLIMASIKNTTQ